MSGNERLCSVFLRWNDSVSTALKLKIPLRRSYSFRCDLEDPSITFNYLYTSALEYFEIPNDSCILKRIVYLEKKVTNEPFVFQDGDSISLFSDLLCKFIDGKLLHYSYSFLGFNVGFFIVPTEAFEQQVILPVRDVAPARDAFQVLREGAQLVANVNCTFCSIPERENNYNPPQQDIALYNALLMKIKGDYKGKSIASRRTVAGSLFTDVCIL